MLTKQIISEIIGDLRALRIDDRISKRFTCLAYVHINVLSKLRGFNAIFLRRENDQLSLYKQDIWFPIECLEMEIVESTTCKEVTVDKIVPFSRSKQKLPKIYSFKNGLLIRDVESLDNGRTYTYTTPREYEKKMKREYVDKSKRYFWITDGHIVIPEEVSVVSVSACFVDVAEARQLNACSCPDCIEPLEEEFLSPEHVLAVVKQETIKDLFQFYKRVVLDENSDNDTNIKTEARNAS